MQSSSTIDADNPQSLWQSPSRIYDGESRGRSTSRGLVPNDSTVELRLVVAGLASDGSGVGWLGEVVVVVLMVASPFHATEYHRNGSSTERAGPSPPPTRRRAPAAPSPAWAAGRRRKRRGGAPPALSHLRPRRQINPAELPLHHPPSRTNELLPRRPPLGPPVGGGGGEVEPPSLLWPCRHRSAWLRRQRQSSATTLLPLC